MAKEQCISVEGTVTEERGNGFFTVVLDNGHEVVARLCGKMEKRNFIRVLTDDRVIVEISPYDLNKGRIVYRYK
jgi:translation initiation factor IF-1